VPAADAPAAASPPNAYTIAKFVPGGRNVRVEVEGKGARTHVTFCSNDYLGLGAQAEVQAAAASTLEEYTLGSCGPRGFYGTTRKHLELEDGLAHFLGTPESISYSDAVAAVASAIPAFCKRGDLLLMDGGVNHAVQTGARLSRSKVTLFRHNDMADLRAQLELVRQQDRRKKDVSLEQRRFVVVEGLYANYGDACPLRAVVELAREFKWRVIVDDSVGFGTLGATGRGIVEHSGLQPKDVDVLLGSLATTLASVGGFCVGAREVVDHQRLSGAGYCFSASAPPFLCATASTALAVLDRRPELVASLRKRCVAVHEELVRRTKGAFTVVSEPFSPVKHCLLAVGPFAAQERAPATARVFAAAKAGQAGPALPELTTNNARQAAGARAAEEAVLHEVVRCVAEEGSLVTRTHYLPGDHLAPRPTLKVSVSLLHTEEEVAALLQALEKVARTVPALVAAAAAAAPAASA